MRQLKAEYYKMKYSRASKWVLVFMAFIFFIPFVVGNDTLFMTFGDYRNIDSMALRGIWLFSRIFMDSRIS